MPPSWTRRLFSLAAATMKTSWPTSRSANAPNGIAAAVGRRLPAVVQEQFEFMGKYIEEGLLEPVDALVGKADKEDIHGVFWDLVSVDGSAADVAGGGRVTAGAQPAANLLTLLYDTHGLVEGADLEDVGVVPTLPQS